MSRVGLQSPLSSKPQARLGRTNCTHGQAVRSQELVRGGRVVPGRRHRGPGRRGLGLSCAARQRRGEAEHLRTAGALLQYVKNNNFGSRVKTGCDRQQDMTRMQQTTGRELEML